MHHLAAQILQVFRNIKKSSVTKTENQDQYLDHYRISSYCCIEVDCTREEI